MESRWADVACKLCVIEGKFSTQSTKHLKDDKIIWKKLKNWGVSLFIHEELISLWLKFNSGISEKWFKSFLTGTEKWTNDDFITLQFIVDKSSYILY